MAKTENTTKALLETRRKQLHTDVLAEVKRILIEKFGGTYTLTEHDEYDRVFVYDDFEETEFRLSSLYILTDKVAARYLSVYDNYEDVKYFGEQLSMDRAFLWLDVLSNNKEK